MSERIDRRIGHDRLLFGVIVIVVAVAATAGISLWSLRRGPSAPQNTAPALTAPAQPSRPDEPLTITLYFPSDGLLAPASVAVKRQPDEQSQAKEILAALFGDRRSAQTALLKDLRLRDVYFDASGTVYVDLIPVSQKELRASAWEELMAVYAVVDTLMQNIEEVKNVRVLLNGREVQTLAGHVDLSRTFEKRTDLVKR